MAGYFRGTLRGASGGLGRLAQAVAMGPMAEQQAYGQEMGLQSRIAQAMASADRDRSEAAYKDTQTANIAQRPGMMEEQAALMSGADLPLVRAIRESVRTGRAPQVELPGPTQDDEPLMGDMQIDPQKRSAVMQALQRLMPVGTNTGDIKVDDWAGALGNFRNQDLGDRVLRGDLKPGAVGASQAAVAGKPLFNSDASGAVLDLFGGSLETANPMAQASIGVKRETAGAQKANAAQSYAAADNSRASAAKTRAEMEDGSNARGVKAPTGYRWSADGTALEYVPGGPADPTTKGAKLAKPPTEGQAKALMFGTRMAVSDDILTGLEGKYSPGAVAAAKGADAMPLIGGVAGRIATASLGPEDQMALQAQRDFINAILRRESGAVIADSEFANAALQYFPQPGDSPQVLRQKAANRRVAIQGLKAEFGEPLTPDFNRIVKEARTGRAAPAAAREGGASGSWGDGAAPAAGGWSIVRED